MFRSGREDAGVKWTQSSDTCTEEEEKDMVGAIFGAFFALALAGLGLALLMWWLWSLWKRSEEEAPPAAIEIKAEALAGDVDRPAVEAEAEILAEEVELPEEEPETTAPAMEVEPPAPEMEPAPPPEPDDLKIIEGIGPRMAGVLQDAGISTFAQLADTPLDEIERVLEEADPRLLRLADPKAWIEQASLAAAGDWDALEALQG
jgi:predicted flap endonuclease-1-like 5' DNA nuclease